MTARPVTPDDVHSLTPAEWRRPTTAAGGGVVSRPVATYDPKRARLWRRDEAAEDAAKKEAAQQRQDERAGYVMGMVVVAIGTGEPPYESIEQAARAIGVSDSALGRALDDGRVLKGRRWARMPLDVLKALAVPPVVMKGKRKRRRKAG